MPITNVSKVKSIVVPLTNLTANNIVTVYQSPALAIGSDLIPKHKIIGLNTFIKSLKAYVKINSLDEAKLPDFKLEDSDTDKVYKTLDIEWKSPRKQLNLYISSNLDNWYPIASISLLNPSGYPYRIYNLQDLFTSNLAIELGSNSRIGVQIEDVGYGLLTVNDTVTIHGSCVEEIFVESSDLQPITNVYVTGSTGGSDSSNVSTGSLIGDNSLISNTFLVNN